MDVIDWDDGCRLAIQLDYYQINIKVIIYIHTNYKPKENNVRT